MRSSDTPALPVNGDERLTYSYDALGRRVAKDVERYQSGAWLPSTQTNYLYWDWNVLEEHRSVVVGAVSTHRYIWGEDLSGTFQGAGGVGGLLLQEVSGGTHAGARWFSHYDGNGNITELTDNTGNVVASYRYAAFGETMSATGPAATANIYRFSTKPLDAELASNSHTSFSQGLYYYGYRFYDAENGRWLNRDPIGESGGVNLYGFVENDGVNDLDLFGLERINGALVSDGSTEAKGEDDTCCKIAQQAWQADDYTSWEQCAWDCSQGVATGAAAVGIAAAFTAARFPAAAPAAGLVGAGATVVGTGYTAGCVSACKMSVCRNTTRPQYAGSRLTWGGLGCEEIWECPKTDDRRPK